MKQRRKELQALNGSSDHVSLEMERAKGAVGRQTLSADDLVEAEVSIIPYSQRQRFKEEIAALSAGRSVARDSVIDKLDLRLKDGLLRVGGLLSRAALPEETKHPLILSKDQYISTLILRYIHQQVGHSGRNHTLSRLCKKYWITNAMSDPPNERVLPNLPPFTNVRIQVDYFGPTEVRRGRRLCKHYGVIFTCLASRAGYLEMDPSLDTDACINALQRFISPRAVFQRGVLKYLECILTMVQTLLEQGERGKQLHF